jgi:C4-dicarboxylate transporter DctM subunit
MATGMPISIALGLSVLTFLFILSDVDPKMVGLKLFTSLDRFEIMAIPFFILAGNFLTAGGVARRMINFATTLIGHWYGGLGLAGVVACAMFAAISGSSVATVVGIGSIILPSLMQQGYPPRFSAGVIATSGALGIYFRPQSIWSSTRWQQAACNRAARPARSWTPPRSGSCSSPRSFPD